MYMATLSFTNNGDKWVAEQQVNADYALHIERKAGGGFWIYQRHVYADLKDLVGIYVEAL